MNDLTWQPVALENGGAEFTGYARDDSAVVQVRVSGQSAAEDTARAVEALLDGAPPSWPDLVWAEHIEPAPALAGRQTWVFAGFPDGADAPTVTVQVRGYDQDAEATVAAALADQLEVA